MNAAQRATVAHYRELSTERVTTFTAPVMAGGAVEVLLLGAGWAWSLLINAKGECSTAEATVGEWETGVTC